MQDTTNVVQQPQQVLTPTKKRSFLCKENCFILILWAVSAFLFMGIGAGIYWFVSTKLEEGRQADQGEADTSEQDEYEGWKTYENEKYGFSFRYPEDWEIEDKLDCEDDELICGYLDVSKDNYTWELWVDPLYTGGGFGYLSEQIVSDFTTVESEVSPAGYDAKIKDHYMSVEDIEQEELEKYNFGEDAWGWSVLFTVDLNGEFVIPWFGSGEMGDDIEGSYFGITYMYKMQQSDLSDLPHKGDEELDEMLEIMDKITNSFSLLEDSSEDIYEGWKTYENEKYGFSFRYPEDWEIEDKIDCKEYELICRYLDVVKDNYTWQLWPDPIDTGEVFGYLSELVVSDPEIVESEVFPASYNAKMKAHFMDDTDVMEGILGEYSFGEDAWGWSVLFTVDLNGEFVIPWFGSGEMGDDIEGSYFGITYMYKMQQSDLSDLPHKGDEELDRMLETMDKITNSFSLEDESLEGEY